MKKTHTLAFYALVTSFITLGTGSALAQQSTSEGTRSELPTTEQRKQGDLQSDMDKSRDNNQMNEAKTKQDVNKKPGYKGTESDSKRQDGMPERTSENQPEDDKNDNKKDPQ